jgi:hypothetical protein
MTQVVSFEGYKPPARFDAVAWTTARIEEASTASGTWSTIDNVTLTPADSDPSVPASRSFTTSLASSTLGLWYRVVFLDGSSNQSQPTDPIQNITGSLYITRDEMKTALSMAGQSYADDDIDRACNTVSRAIDRACGKGRRFYQATETRYYTPDETHRYPYYGAAYRRECRLEIDDLTTCTTLTVDTGGDGSYATTWTEGTDFFLDPPNALADGEPFTEVLVRARGGRYFPAVQRAVKITGVFGWPSVPVEVSQYAQIFAAQLVLRGRQAPFGILMQGMEVGATARLMRVDPDFDRLLGRLVKSRPFF